MSFISVALPVYASEIAWLAMDSLCNQITDAKWELIIYEDEQYPMGEDYYLSYLSRLKKAGCVSVSYKYSKERIPLSFKWRELSLQARKNSFGILLQAADNYSHPFRIQTAAEMLKEYDWMYCPKTIFYQVNRKKTMLYDSPNIGIGADMSIRKDVAQQLPKEIKWSSVDTWLYESLKKIKPAAKIYQDTSDNWMKGLATDGANRISLKRKYIFDNPKPPFYKTDIKPETCVPDFVWAKLKTF